MKKLQLEMGLVSAASLEDRKYGLGLLEALCGSSPGLCPVRVSNHEPIRNEVPPGDYEAALRYWAWPFLWKSRDAEGSCSQGITDRGQSGKVQITVRRGSEATAALPDCFARLAVRLEAQYAALFVSTPEEISLAARAGSALNTDRAGKHWFFTLSNPRHERILPDIYWQTAFGPRFVRRIGLQRILGVPAYSARLLAEDLVLVQLTERFSDVAFERKEFVAVRARVKEHLGADLFFQATEASEHDPNGDTQSGVVH